MLSKRPRLIWIDKSNWPIDNLGYIFLARAIHSIGVAMCSSDWTADTPLATWLKPLPSLTEASFHDKEWATTILCAIKPNYKSNPITKLSLQKQNNQEDFSTLNEIGKILSETEIVDYNINMPDWMDAQSFVATRNETERPALDLWENLKELVVSEAIHGHLKCCTRPRLGGDFEEIPSGWWNTEKIRYEHRFNNCTIGRLNPYAESYSHWIYVSEIDLIRLVQKLSGEQIFDVVDYGSEISRTGMPGRPTSRHLILVELERRWKAGQEHPSLAVWACELSNWLATAHKASAQMKPRSVENAIRVRHRELKSSEVGETNSH